MPTSTEEAKALLERVLQEPFEFFEPSDEVFDFHVHRWFKYLIGEFPLWTWQPHAFNRLHDTELPTTYPVDDLIESVLEDEGIDPSYQASGQPLDALSFNLDRRRSGIASGSPLANATLLEGASASLTPGIVQFRYARDLTDWEPDTEYTVGGYLSPYEDIGRELVWLIEAREQARANGDKAALAEAVENVTSFLEQVAAIKRGQGRWREGPSEEILEGLVDEGRRVFELLWTASPTEISDRTDDLLAEYEVPRAEERSLWATRLALPILSKPEIRALESEIDQSAVWSRSSPRPTPRRFAIFVLAHRLGMEPSTVARRAAGGSGGAYEEFQRAVNPIDAFLPEGRASDRQ